MCEPATISAIVGAAASAISSAGAAAGTAAAAVAANAGAVAAGVSVASTAAAAYAQHQGSKATSAASREAQDAANAGLDARGRQVNANAPDEMVDRSKQALRELGAMNTIFADSGLAGNTQNRLAGEVEGNAQADLTTVERNRQAAATQNASEGAAIRARAQSQINSAPRPSILGTGLQIAATGANYYASRNPPRK